MYELKITATGDYVLSPGSYDQAFVSGVSFTVKGLTGSITVQKRQAVGNLQNYTPTAFNCSYVNANSDAYVVAGTAVTADGQYLVSATAQEVVLHVTAVTGTCSVVVTPVEGAVGASGGGASSSVTIIDGGDAALGSTTDAAVTNPASAGTLIALTKGLLTAPTTPLPTSVNDATGTQTAAVKAASTAPLATDPALVTAISPNNWIANNATPANAALALPVYSVTTAQNSGVQQPVRTAGRVAAGDTGNSSLSVGGVVLNPVSALWDPMPGSAVAGQLMKPYAFRANEWGFACATGGLTNTTAATMRAAPGAGIYVYCTAVQFANSSAVGTELEIRSGAAGTVIWRGYAPPSMTSAASVTFPNPIVATTTNVLLEIACVTTAAAVRVSAQGYTATNA